MMQLKNWLAIQIFSQTNSQMIVRTNIPMLQHHNDSNPFSFHRDNSFESKHAITIQCVIPITHPKLITWVQERKIDLALAKQYCKEVHYQNQSGRFFSIGYRNDRGGSELSSPSGFKGCFPPKDIKTFRNDNDSYLVFEGFWDFLSYLAIQKV